MANTARSLPAIPAAERGPLAGVVSSEGKGEAEASGSFRVPELRLVPPEPEKDKVITELPATRGENETAKWVREQVKLAAPKEKPTTLPELSARLGQLIQERQRLREQLKKLDQPVHKALEALQGLGFLKDTLRTFGNWKEERGQIESTIESLDQTIGQLGRDINGLAKIQTPEIVEQAGQVAGGSSVQDQAVMEGTARAMTGFTRTAQEVKATRMPGAMSKAA